MKKFSIFLIALCILALQSGCGSDSSVSDSGNLQHTTVDPGSMVEATTSVPSDPSLDSQVSISGCWEPVDTAEDGFHLASLEQWAFSTNGECLCLTNGKPSEFDTWTYDPDTHLITIDCGDENVYLLYYDVMGSKTMFLSDATGTAGLSYQEVSEFTTIEDSLFEKECSDRNAENSYKSYSETLDLQKGSMPYSKLQLGIIARWPDGTDQMETAYSVPEFEQLEMLPGGEFKRYRNNLQISDGYWFVRYDEKMEDPNSIDVVIYYRDHNAQPVLDHFTYLSNDIDAGLYFIDGNRYESDSNSVYWGYYPADQFSSMPMNQFYEEFIKIYNKESWSQYQEAAIRYIGEDEWNRLNQT